MERVDEHRTTVPAELSSFVGRRHELEQLDAALAAHRLVTLLGPGGVGKTRLAYRAAADPRRAEGLGVVVVELATVSDPDLVVECVLSALGLEDVPGTAPPGAAADRVVARVGTREVLVVLDNCEQVEGAVARLVEDLLRRCPAARVLTTSRHRLGLPGEATLVVPPLAVPSPDRGTGTPSGLLAYDAVRLFAERAVGSWSEFEITEVNQAAVAELVRRLDGVPLAIELAAVRVRMLSVPQILERLDDRFALLTRGSRTVAARQQTLRALIEWSHDLLTPSEQLLWARASVFNGSFDLDAVLGVACDDALPAEQAEVLLDGLVDKSILTREGPDGDRFGMLQSLREYAAGQLGDARVALQERHRAYRVAWGRRGADELYGPDQVAWFDRLGADHDNLRAVLDLSLCRPAHAVEGLRLIGDLQHYWVMVGRFTEGRRWCDRLLQAVADPGPDLDPDGLARVAGLVVAGRLAVLQGDPEEGRARLGTALAALPACPETPLARTWRGHALHGLALATMFWGEPADALDLLEEALALHRGGVDDFGVPLALVQLATVHATLGHHDRAMARAEECVALSRARPEQWCAGLARWTQALTAWGQGRVGRVAVYAREVLRLKQPFGDRLGMSMSIEVLAWSVAAGEDDPELAATLLGAADAAVASVGGALFGHLVGDHRACVVRTRAALGDDAYDEAFARGAALPFDAAVALSLRRRGGRRGQGVSVPGPSTLSGSARLTRREWEIAQLVADGLTDRAIAERLVTSSRTAEGHVGRILKKLGVGSRAQVRAWVSEQRRGED